MERARKGAKGRVDRVGCWEEGRERWIGGAVSICRGRRGRTEGLGWRSGTDALPFST